MRAPSWQARLLSFALRQTFKRQLAAARDVAQVRRLMGREAAGRRPDMAIEPWPHAGGMGERLRCLRTPPRARLLYLHGGGFVACNPRTHRPITAALARRGFEVWVPDYGLAPEHPFPHALEQLLAVHAQVCEGLDSPAQMLLAGDSAGGGLVLSLMLLLRQEGDALPAAAALLSPFADLTLSGASIQANAERCAMFRGPMLERAVALYLAGADAAQPLASPVHADLAGLPPLQIHVGADEVLLDDARRLAQGLSRSGGQADLRIWPAVPHDWPLFGRLLPEARQTLDEIAAFLHHHAHRLP